MSTKEQPNVRFDSVTNAGELANALKNRSDRRALRKALKNGEPTIADNHGLRDATTELLSNSQNDLNRRERKVLKGLGGLYSSTRDPRLDSVSSAESSIPAAAEKPSHTEKETNLQSHNETLQKENNELKLKLQSMVGKIDGLEETINSLKEMIAQLTSNMQQPSAPITSVPDSSSETPEKTSNVVPEAELKEKKAHEPSIRFLTTKLGELQQSNSTITLTSGMTKFLEAVTQKNVKKSHIEEIQKDLEAHYKSGANKSADGNFGKDSKQALENWNTINQNEPEKPQANKSEEPKEKKTQGNEVLKPNEKGFIEYTLPTSIQTSSIYKYFIKEVVHENPKMASSLIASSLNPIMKKDGVLEFHFYGEKNISKINSSPTKIQIPKNTKITADFITNELIKKINTHTADKLKKNNGISFDRIKYHLKEVGITEEKKVTQIINFLKGTNLNPLSKGFNLTEINIDSNNPNNKKLLYKIALGPNDARKEFSLDNKKLFPNQRSIPLKNITDRNGLIYETLILRDIARWCKEMIGEEKPIA